MPADLQPGFTDRPATPADLEGVAAIINDYWEQLAGVRKFTQEEGRSMLAAPGFDMATSTRVVVAPDGQIAGCTVVMDTASPPVHPQVLGAVHSRFERLGIGTFLLQWAEARARQAIPRAPGDARVSMQLVASAAHAPTMRLFEKMGIRPIRRSLLMAIDLDEVPPAPVWPAGIVLRTYQEHPDLRAVYRAVEDAFQDHWGFVPQDEEEALRRWQSRIASGESFDPTLWFLLMDGEEIAATALCKPALGEDREMGWVNQLGVRRPWRRRGLALQLLYHVFGEFRRRGRKRAGLGVDAQSLTGATRLYEKAGMRVAREITDCEKELRAGREMATQSL